MSDRLVTVATFSNLVEAHHCQAVLEEAGIPVMMAGEQMNSIFGLPGLQWAEIQVTVPDEAAARAFELLDQQQAVELEVPKPPPSSEAITRKGGLAPGVPATAITTSPEQFSDPLAESNQELPPPVADDEEDNEGSDAPVYLSRREELADHILTLTLFCWLMPPLFVLPFVVLLYIWCSPGFLRPKYLNYTLGAAALNPIFWGLIYLVLALLRVV
ncbi:MAG: DUF2007 domain-containing protein [Gemmataceae bacterium]